MIQLLKKLEIYDWFTFPAVLVWITHPIGWIITFMYLTELAFRITITQNIVTFKKYVIWHKRLFAIPQILLLGIYLAFFTGSSNAYLSYGYIAILVWIIVSAAVTTWVTTNREFINQTVNSGIQILATGIILSIQGAISFQKPFFSEIGISSTFVIMYGILTIPIGLIFLQTKYRRLLVLSRLAMVFIWGILYHIWV